MTNNLKDLQSLKFRNFILGFKNEPMAFWLLCFYILLEYIRPQAMYPFIDIIPWGQVAIISCVVSVFFLSNKAKGVNILDKMFISFSILIILSGVFAWNPDASMEDWTTFASWILMYFCVVSILTTPSRIFLFILFFILINFKLSQHGARTFALRGFSFTHWGLSGSPGWFHNSGEFALQMVVLFSISICILLMFKDFVKSKLRWLILLSLFPGTAALSVIGSSSRGGQLALLAVVSILLLKAKKKLRMTLIFLVVISGAIFFLPDEQLSRFHTIGEDETSELRLVHWQNAIEVFKNNPWGIGYSNWGEYYRFNYTPVKVEEIHNTILQVFVEIGILGGSIFVFMVIYSIILNNRIYNHMKYGIQIEDKAVAAIAVGVNLGLVGSFIAGLFMSVLYYPMFWLAFALTSSLQKISKQKLNKNSRYALSVPDA